MTDKLPPNLLVLFQPRPSLRYLPPADHAPEERKTAQFSGVAAFLQQAEEHKKELPPPSAESWFEKKLRETAEKAELAKKLSNPKELGYDPKNDPQIRGDAFKTLFLARLSYDTTQQDLERVFSRFGPIERIRIVTDTHAKKESKSAKKNRGYAFIVYEKESDMRTAYKETENIHIRDRRVLVDVERGRTVADWAPRRFGGGLGGRGYTRGAARPMASGGPYAPRGFSDRGGRGGGPPRGGFRGSDRGPPGGGRDMNGRGVGYQGSGFGSRGAAPPNAPSGPGGGRSGEYDDRRPRNGGYSSGGRDYGRGGSGSNMEPVRPRDGPGGGYGDRDRPRDGGRERYGGDRDRDRERGDRDRGYGRREDDFAGSKRPHEDGARYDDRSKRRY